MLTRSTTYLFKVRFFKSAWSLAKIESFCRQTTYNPICFLLDHIQHLVTIPHRGAHGTKHAIHQTFRRRWLFINWRQFRNCQGTRDITDYFLNLVKLYLINLCITKTNSRKTYSTKIQIFSKHIPLSP